MNNQPDSKHRQQLAYECDDPVPSQIPSTPQSAPENKQQGRAARYANEQPRRPPGRHFGPVPADLAPLASIDQANVAGFNTTTASNWALAQVLGLGPDELHRLDGIADLL